METDYFFILSRENQSEVLLIQQGDQWTLPCVKINKGWFPKLVEPLTECVRNQFGLDTVVLRHLFDGDFQVCELEMHMDHGVLSQNGQWFDKRCLDLSFSASCFHRVLKNWFLQGTDISPLRAPWERLGWFDEAVDWIQVTLQSLDYRLQNIAQVKGAWPNSCLLRCETNRGNVYFKAVHSRPPNEPSVVQYLSTVWSAYVPTLLAVDLERHWMIMAEFNGEKLSRDKLSESHWMGAVRTFSQFQVNCVQDLTPWISLGCSSRGLDDLPERFADLISDTVSLKAAPSGFSDDEIDVLGHFVPICETLCRQLADYHIPDTVVEQDFGYHNLVVQDESYLFFDWSDVGIAHPFWGISRFLDFTPRPKGAERWDWTFDHVDDGLRRSVRDAYLEPWQAYETPDRLLDAFVLIRRLADMYMAVKWHLELCDIELDSVHYVYVRDIMQKHLWGVLETKHLQKC